MEKLTIEGLSFLFSQFSHLLSPLFDLFPIHLLRKLGGGCSLSLRKGEDMEIRKREGFDQLIGLFELLFCLSWKSYNDIRTDGELWDSPMEFLDEIGEERTVIMSIHPLQNLIISALDGNVEVRADLRRL